MFGSGGWKSQKENNKLINKKGLFEDRPNTHESSTVDKVELTFEKLDDDAMKDFLDKRKHARKINLVVIGFTILIFLPFLIYFLQLLFSQTLIIQG